MDYSAMIAYTWLAVLEQLEWECDFDEKREWVRIVILDIGAKSKLKKFNMVVLCRKSDCLVYGYTGRTTPLHRREDIAELIWQINNKMLFGYFRMDDTDGEPFFYYAIDVEDGVISKKMVLNAISFACDAMTKYGNALTDVMEGRRTPKEAYKNAINAMS